MEVIKKQTVVERYQRDDNYKETPRQHEYEEGIYHLSHLYNYLLAPRS